MKEAEAFLTSINTNLGETPWALQRLRLFPLLEPENKPLCKLFDTITEQHQRINISQVIGTTHMDYANRETWFSMLYNGKRMPLSLAQYKENPEYYFSKEKSKYQRITYATINGRDFYITTDGNHRTTLAKFILPQAKEQYLYDIDITYYTLKKGIKLPSRLHKNEDFF